MSIQSNSLRKNQPKYLGNILQRDIIQELDQNFYRLIINWEDILGPYLGKICWLSQARPILNSNTKISAKTTHQIIISTTPQKHLDVQYNRHLIRDRINFYFNSNIVKSIIVKATNAPQKK